MEAATITVGGAPFGVAVTPDGKHAYVANLGGTVSVIDTTTTPPSVTTTIPVGGEPNGVAVTADGKHAYVPNGIMVSVIDTASNTVVATVPVPQGASSVAVTPDGKHVYVLGGVVSVIDTASNAVVATVPATGGFEIAIVPPPPGVPFLAFYAGLDIHFSTAPNQDAFTLATSFTLSSTAPVINPLTDPVTLQAGTFAVTIPPGSFKEFRKGGFSFEGVINGVILRALIKSTGTLRYAFQAEAQGASFTGTTNTVYVTLAIGGGSFSNSNSGATSVAAAIFH